MKNPIKELKAKWFKIKKPKSPAELFVGKVITMYPTAQDVRDRTNGERLVVVHIVGNLTHQTMFQVNGGYLVSMLDAYCELNREELVSMKDHQDFLSTVAESVVHQSKLEEKKPSLIDRKPTLV